MIATYHVDRFRVDHLGNHSILVCEEVDHLVEGRALHFLPFQVAQRLRKVEECAALSDLLNKQLLPFTSRRFCERIIRK